MVRAMHARITSSMVRAREFKNKKLNIETLTKESERVFHGKEKERGRSFENPEIQGKERWRLTKKGILGFRAFVKDKGSYPKA